jgi:hypothetical protein
LEILNIGADECPEPDLTEQRLDMSFDVAPVDLERGRLPRGASIGDDDRLRQTEIAELGDGKVSPLDALRFDRILPVHDLPQKAASLLARGLNSPR